MNLKDIRPDFIVELHNIGIPEVDVTLKEYKKNPKQYLGCYRSMSQFGSRPIICIDTEIHTKILKEQDRFSELELKNAVMETLLHEYGHVIEEYIRFDARTNPNKTIINKLNTFEDMEDFAESFARWVTGRESYFEDEVKLFKELIDFYVNKVFSPESVTAP